MDNFLSIIVTAIQADNMGKFGFLAFWTCVEVWILQRIMSATFSGARVGMAMFWMSHSYASLLGLIFSE